MGHCGNPPGTPVRKKVNLSTRDIGIISPWSAGYNQQLLPHLAGGHPSIAPCGARRIQALDALTQMGRAHTTSRRDGAFLSPAQMAEAPFVQYLLHYVKRVFFQA